MNLSRVVAAPRLLGAVTAVLAWLLLVAGVLAHGDTLPPPPASVLDLLGGWSFDATLQLPILAAVVAYLWAVRRVDRAHPRNPVPLRRTVAWLAGLVVIEIALQSSVDEYEGVLFSVHMVQHILLIFFAAPLLVLGAPITLLLRLASADMRKRVVLPILHSRIVRAISFPVVAWLLFAGTMWGTHFSPLFDLALESPLVHDAEHALYLFAAMLFWWPVAAVDPSPWRMPHPARLVYVFLQMPQNSFLGLAIYSATQPLYAHYASLALAWGPPALADQQLAGGIMWVVGDLLFLGIVLLIVADWARDEDRKGKLADARLDEIEARDARYRRAGRYAGPRPLSGAAADRAEASDPSD